TPPRCSAAAFRLGRRMTGRSTGQLEPCIKSSVSLPPDLSAQVVITCCAATPRSSASDFLLYRLCVWANFGSWELLWCGKITGGHKRRQIAGPSHLEDDQNIRSRRLGCERCWSSNRGNHAQWATNPASESYLPTGNSDWFSGFAIVTLSHM